MTYHHEKWDLATKVLAGKLSLQFRFDKRDTFLLAALHNLEEAYVSRLLHWERCHRKGLPV